MIILPRNIKAISTIQTWSLCLHKHYDYLALKSTMVTLPSQTWSPCPHKNHRDPAHANIMVTLPSQIFWSPCPQKHFGHLALTNTIATLSSQTRSPYPHKHDPFAHTNMVTLPTQTTNGKHPSQVALTDISISSDTTTGWIIGGQKN